MCFHTYGFGYTCARCRLEFIIVIAGIVDTILIFAGSGSLFQFMRALRVVLIFKTSRAVPKLRRVHHVLAAYVLCMQRSLGVLICALFFNVAFAIIGLTLFGGNGQMRYFCTVNTTEAGAGTAVVLAMPPRHCVAPPERQHGAFVPLDGNRCSEPEETCVQVPGLPSLDGLHGFDTLPSSVMTLWTLMSFRQDKLMVLETVDAVGLNVPAVFFFGVTVLGSVILYNYFTAIFVLSYMEILGRFEMQELTDAAFAASDTTQQGAENANTAAPGLLLFDKDAELHSVREQLAAVCRRSVADARRRWAVLKKKQLVAKCLRGIGYVRRQLVVIVVHPNEPRLCRSVLESQLPRKTYLAALVSVVTFVQVRSGLCTACGVLWTSMFEALTQACGVCVDGRWACCAASIQTRRPRRSALSSSSTPCASCSSCLTCS